MTPARVTGSVAPEHRKLKRDIEKFSRDMRRCVIRLDRMMRRPQSPERGKMIAIAVNAVVFLLDSLDHFTLGKSFDAINRSVEKLEKEL